MQIAGVNGKKIASTPARGRGRTFLFAGAYRTRHDIATSLPFASAGTSRRRTAWSAPQRQLMDRSLAQPGAGSPKSTILAPNWQSSIALSHNFATAAVALPLPGLPACPGAAGPLRQFRPYVASVISMRVPADLVGQPGEVQ